VAVSFVDLSVKQISPTELKRFTSRYGTRALLDENSRTYRDAGYAYLRHDDDELLDRLLRDQALIRLPLVRFADHVVVGADERGWKEMLKFS
jgi:arsenate reductase-like glutaredoxin family protein